MLNSFLPGITLAAARDDADALVVAGVSARVGPVEDPDGRVDDGRLGRGGLDGDLDGLQDAGHGGCLCGVDLKCGGVVSGSVCDDVSGRGGGRWVSSVPIYYLGQMVGWGARGDRWVEREGGR